MQPNTVNSWKSQRQISLLFTKKPRSWTSNNSSSHRKSSKEQDWSCNLQISCPGLLTFGQVAAVILWDKVYLMLNVDLLSSPISFAGSCFFLFFGAVLLWSKVIFFTSKWQRKHGHNGMLNNVEVFIVAQLLYTYCKNYFYLH